MIPLSALVAIGALAQGGAAPVVGVTTAELYGHRLLLGADRNPRVALGLAVNLDQVELASANGLSVIGRHRTEGPWVRLRLGRRGRFVRSGGAAAALVHAVVVATLEGGARSQREAMLAQWRQRGEAGAFALDVGIVFGIGGKLVDNRATLILVRPSASLAQTERVARQLHDAHGVDTRVVAVVKKLPELELTVEDNGAGQALIGPLLVTDRGGAAVTLRNKVNPAGQARATGAEPSYVDALAIAPDNTGRIAVVNVTTVDEILKGVVPSEMFASAPLEALKAQAVTARGAVFAKIGRHHLADPFALCDEQHCQVYGGTSAYHPETSRAVEETRGELAFLGDELVDSVYSSTCGGHTENAEVVWNTPPKASLRGLLDVPGAASAATRPAAGFGGAGETGSFADLSDEATLRRFLSSTPDSFCARASVARKDKLRWEKRIAAADLDRLLFGLGVGHVTAFEVLGRGVSGRVRALRVTGDRASVVIQRELPVRRALGNLNSGAFVIDVERDGQGNPTSWIFRGAGWGHGVGMCQVGAIGMAEAGYDYRAILSHYYNGATVEQIY
ncbi:MAG: SpoIID/LytB domain-containing protein [Deltaproteobacteria bacterium]|nr:SpoIID/LytB domain-containing protein [Deltaproteobacteria bacterium]